jgi:hypothetical protein
MSLSLDELVDLGYAYARTVLVGNPEASLMPIFHIQFKDRAPAVIGAPWTNDQEKANFFQALRETMKATRRSVISYSFLSEAWTATEDARHPIGLTPSQRQDRKECVVITASDGRDTRLKVWEIIRGPDATVTALVLNDEGKMDVYKGRLVDLLNDDA